MPILAKNNGENIIYALISILLSTYSLSFILAIIIPARKEPVIAATPKKASAKAANTKHNAKLNIERRLV